MILKNTYIWFEEYDIGYVCTQYMRFEKYDVSTRMNGNGWMLMDGRGQTHDTIQTDVDEH
jgi:hypothetical protein